MEGKRESRAFTSYPPFITAALLGMAWLGLLGSPTSSVAATYPTGHNPDGLPEVGCFWTGPFTRADEKTNVAFPGTEITYWAAKFSTPAGSKLTLDGRFPYARYSSLNTYDNQGASQSSLPDRRIRPDSGSVNPSIPGRSRQAAKRRFSVEILSKAPPPNPAPNTHYAEPTPDGYQVIIYRVYIPDRGRNLSGGTGVPRASLTLADGTEVPSEDLCEETNAIHYFPSTTMPLRIYENLVDWEGKDPAVNPAENPLQFSRYWNLENAVARYKTAIEQKTTWQAYPTYVGTQYDNNDARYMTGAYSFDFGKVLVLRGTLPTTPRTRRGKGKMTTGQLTVWDMCIIQSLVTTKTWKCVYDEQLPLRTRGRKKRQYTIVISKPADRPKNATFRCGVWWMPPDPEGDGVSRPNVGQLLTRNVLPARDFKRSSWAVANPFPATARRTMGQYYPRGTYTSKKRFERVGCAKKKRR